MAEYDESGYDDEPIDNAPVEWAHGLAESLEEEAEQEPTWSEETQEPEEEVTTIYQDTDALLAQDEIDDWEEGFVLGYTEEMERL